MVLAENEMRLRQHTGSLLDGAKDVEAVDTLACSRTERTFMKDENLQSAPEGGSSQDGPYKISDGCFAALHAVDKEGIALLPELECKDLPNSMWGMGIMTIVMDCEDMASGVDCKEKVQHCARFTYVLICGILNLLVMASVPYFLHHHGIPLIPSWAADPYNPIAASYNLVPFKTLTTTKPPKSHKHHSPSWKPPPSTTQGPLEALEPVQTNQLHSFVTGPLSEHEMCHVKFMDIPCGHIGFFLGLFLFLWISHWLREICMALDIMLFCKKMPKVHSEYVSLLSFPGPSKCNHIIRRNGKNEVYAVTSFSKFMLVSLMLFKVAFHVLVGYWGTHVLIMATSLSDLIFTFLALWFVGVVLPPTLLYSLLPWAANEVNTTKFAMLESHARKDDEASLQAQAFKSMMLSAAFAVVTLATLMVAITKIGGPLMDH